MFVFGHTGITIGAGVIVEAITERLNRTRTAREPNINVSANKAKDASHRLLNKPGILSVGEWLDYRLLLIASMLPDIIDKPLGQVIFRETISYGRIYAHTLVFVLITGILGIWVLKKWGNGWLLIMSFGSLLHDLEDQLWRWPKVLLWPFNGWAFPKEDLNAWLSGVFQAILTEPDVYVTELVGIAILTFVAIKVLRNKIFLSALRTGHIS